MGLLGRFNEITMFKILRKVLGICPSRHLTEGPDLAEEERARFGRGGGLKGAR